MKRGILALIVIGIGIIAGLQWLDVGAITSTTRTEHHISTFAYPGNDTEISVSGNVAVEVVGPDDDSLVEAVHRQLLADPAMGPASLVAAADSDDTARLIVDITDGDVSWLPVWSHAVIEPHVVYASDGDVSWKDETPVVMNSAAGPVLRVRGDLTIADESRGLMSRPGYRRHLAQQVASGVREAMAQQLTNR